METKHTQGQWVIHNERFIALESARHKGAMQQYICEMWGMSIATGKANAQLISTAPELLNACIFMLEAIQKGEVHRISETILNNVIEKATKTQ